MYTLFLIKMPSKGNKTIVSRMIKDVPSNCTIKDFFKTMLLPHAKEEVGELVKVSIVLGDQSEPADIDDVNDLVGNIVAFGAKQIIYFVDQQTAAPQAAPAPLSSMLPCCSTPVCRVRFARESCPRLRFGLGRIESRWRGERGVGP